MLPLFSVRGPLRQDPAWEGKRRKGNVRSFETTSSLRRRSLHHRKTKSRSAILRNGRAKRTLIRNRLKHLPRTVEEGGAPERRREKKKEGPSGAASFFFVSFQKRVLESVNRRRPSSPSAPPILPTPLIPSTILEGTCQPFPPSSPVPFSFFCSFSWLPFFSAGRGGQE